LVKAVARPDAIAERTTDLGGLQIRRLSCGGGENDPHSWLLRGATSCWMASAVFFLWRERSDTGRARQILSLTSSNSLTELPKAMKGIYLALGLGAVPPRTRSFR